GGTALATLDLDRGDADLRELRDQADGVPAHGLLDRVQPATLHHEAALAQGRVAGALVGFELVDQHLVEPRAKHLALALPAHRARGRAGTALLGDSPVMYDDRWHRPSAMMHRLPKPKTSTGTGRSLVSCDTCAIDSTRGSTARRMP